MGGPVLFDVSNPQSLTVAHAKSTSYSWRRLIDAIARLTLSWAGILASRLPRASLPPLALGAAVAQLALSPSRAWGHQDNLKKVLPASERAWHRRFSLTLKALRSFGMFILEFFKISRMDGDELTRCFTFIGLGEIDGALKRGSGVILVTSHIGNWEAGARALAHLRYRLHVVAGVQFSRSLSPHVKALKERVGVDVVSPGPGEYRRLIDALRANEVVALVVDGGTFERGVDVPFFSGMLKAPAGPARLAALTGASVISTQVVRTAPMRFDMGFRTVWGGWNGRWGNRPSGTGEHDSTRVSDFVGDLTADIMKSQEEAIGRHLHQWCIFRPLWPDSAPGNER